MFLHLVSDYSELSWRVTLEGAFHITLLIVDSLSWAMLGLVLHYLHSLYTSMAIN